MSIACLFTNVLHSTLRVNGIDFCLDDISTCRRWDWSAWLILKRIVKLKPFDHDFILFYLSAFIWKLTKLRWFLFTHQLFSRVNLQKELSFPKHHVPFEFMSSLKYIFLSKNKLTKAFSFHFSCCVLDPRIINSQNIFTWFTFLKDTLERRKRRCSLYHHTHTFSHVGYVETQKSLMCWTFMSM